MRTPSKKPVKKAPSAKSSAQPSLFDTKTFINEYISCLFLFLTFPTPLLGNSWVSQWAIQLLTVVLNNQLFGSFLSPAIVAGVYMTGGVTKRFAVATLAAHALVAVTVYPLYAATYPPSLVFGPHCTADLSTCFLYETACTFTLTILCSLPMLVNTTTRFGSVMKSVWIGLSVRAMMEACMHVTGASMNVLIALSWFLFNGELFSAEAAMYYASATSGGVLGVVVFGWGVVWWKGKEKVA